MSNTHKNRPHIHNRTKLFKIVTSFKVDDDLCHSAHFVWAADEKDAKRFVVKHLIIFLVL
jgi:hypothetical protein